jgi:thioesterase domain-containing protein
VGALDDFFELGGQSFAAARIVNRIAERFGRHLPIDVLMTHRTVRSLAGALSGGEPASPLVPMGRGIGTSAWFFVHPAGGGVMCYRPLAEALACCFHGLQWSPAADAGQALSIEEIAASYCRALRAVPARTRVVGGWSSGGTIAFEIARQLEEAGEPVACVVMIDAPAPLQLGEVDDATIRRWFAEDVDAGTGRDAAALQSLLRTFSTIVRAGRRYRPPRIHADLLVLRASEGQVTEFADHPAVASPDWGWSRFTHGHVHQAMVPGTHHTLWRAPNLDAIVRELTALAERCGDA